MNNVTTPETAQRLKSAGFPQPEPKPGQVWHAGCDFEWPIIIVKSEMLVDGVEDGVVNPNFSIFAPTAPDILAELGVQYLFWFDGFEKVWICADNIAVFTDFFGGVKFTHTNPAEAAALVWLDKHEKQNG